MYGRRRPIALSPAEVSAGIAALTFYSLRALSPAFDTLLAVTVVVAAVPAGVVAAGSGFRRRSRFVAIAMILTGVLSGVTASARVREYEAPPSFGLATVDAASGSGPILALALRAEGDARRAPNGEFQVWARIYEVCSGDLCTSANARTFVRDRSLPPILAGTAFQVSGELQRSDDAVFLRPATGEHGKIRVLPEDQSGRTAERARNMRNRVTRAFRVRISTWSRKSRGVFAALFAGDRTDLPHTVERRMREAGAAHILALSGMHLGILAGVVYVFSRRISKPGTARAAACVFAIIYLGFAGLRPSLVRAVVMLCIATIVRAREGTVNIRLVLALSFIAHALVLPTDLTSLAFGLSFLSLLGLVVLAGGVHVLLPRRLPRVVRGGLAAGLAAQTTTAPLVYAVFGVMHPVGILASIILTPVAVAIIGLGTGALVSGPFSTPLVRGLGVMVEAMDLIARSAGRVPSLENRTGVAVFLLCIPVLLAAARLRYRLAVRRWRRYTHEQRLL